jgi:hypothetical protein
MDILLIKVHFALNFSEIILYLDELPLERSYFHKLFIKEQSHRNLFFRFYREILFDLKQSI